MGPWARGTLGLDAFGPPGSPSAVAGVTMGVMGEPHPGPFYANWGPESGPIRHRDAGASVGVMAEPGCCGFPIGGAHPTSWRPDRRGPIALFWLEINKRRLPGLWECQDRRFVPAAGDPKWYGTCGPPEDRE